MMKKLVYCLSTALDRLDRYDLQGRELAIVFAKVGFYLLFSSVVWLIVRNGLWCLLLFSRTNERPHRKCVALMIGGIVATVEMVHVIVVVVVDGIEEIVMVIGDATEVEAERDRLPHPHQGYFNFISV